MNESTHLLAGWRFKALIASIIIAVLAYFLITLWAGWRSVLYAFLVVGWKGILIALGLSLVNFFLRFKRWERFLENLGHPLPFWPNLRIYLAGFALTTTPGKTGEALRGVFLKDRGVDYRHSFGAFLAERLSDMLAVMSIALLGLWAYPQARIIILATAVGLGFIIFALQKDPWLKWIERRVDAHFKGKFAHIFDFCIETILAFRSAFRPQILMYGTFLGILAWGAQGVAFYYILKLMGIELSMMTAQFIYAFSLMIGGLSLLPGGLGGTEVTMLQLLALEGVPFADATAATVLIRLTTLWFSVLLGLLALPKTKVK
jgi:uncharacterized protein (TIRG00374 family)